MPARIAFTRCLLACGLLAMAAVTPSAATARTAAVSTIQESQLRDFNKNPKPVQEVIRAALALTREPQYLETI